MISANVSNNPLRVMISLFPSTLNEGVGPNGSYNQLQIDLLQVLPNLPSSLAAQLTPLTPLLNSPLQTVFDANWQAVQAAEQAQAAAVFTAVAANSDTPASDVTCTLPSNGTVVATVWTPPTDSTFRLAVEYQLPGGTFHFSAGLLGATWNLNFDAALVVSMLTPPSPFNLVPSSFASLQNPSLNPDNFGAKVDKNLDNFFTGLANFFTGGNYVSDIDLVDAAVVQDAGAFPVSSAALGQFLSLINNLNAAGPECILLGLTQYAFSIPDGATLTLTITHPLDSGPSIQNASNAGISAGVLSASATQVLPGASISVLGSRFPLDTTTQVELTWFNTSSGAPTKAELMVGGVKTTITASSLSGNLYTYKPSGLTPGKSLVFQARCGDALAWSSWGPPLTTSTLASNVVDLTLNPTMGGAPIPLGSSTLSATSTDWPWSGQIPQTTSPGLYNLTASIAGQSIASTPITVTTTLSAEINIVDPTTLLITPQGVLYPSTQLTILGQNFPDGAVAVTVQEGAALMTTSVNGQFTTVITTPIYTGSFSVTATSGSALATLNPPLLVQAPPQ